MKKSEGATGRINKSALGQGLADDLSNYDAGAYEKPSVTVDVAVCAFLSGTMQVLLIKRQMAPFRDFWALPGSFVSIERRESLENAALRTLRNEAGMHKVFLEQLKTYGDPNRDPRMRVITVAYYALVVASKVDSPEELGATKGWFALNNLPKKLAFDHQIILSDLRERLRGKISYSPIAFRLLDSRFTWNELQEVYEDILGKKLLTPNFRRKLQSMYEIREIGEKKKTRGRPSSLLEFGSEREF